MAALHKPQDVLVDLAGVSYIDSSGVANLVEGYQLARQLGVDFALLGVSPAAGKVLGLARLDEVFTQYRSLEDWLEKAQPTGA
jgi:anti-sigma B factor antagonist